MAENVSTVVVIRVDGLKQIMALWGRVVVFPKFRGIPSSGHDLNELHTSYYNQVSCRRCKNQVMNMNMHNQGQGQGQVGQQTLPRTVHIDPGNGYCETQQHLTMKNDSVDNSTVANRIQKLEIISWGD